MPPMRPLAHCLMKAKNHVPLIAVVVPCRRRVGCVMLAFAAMPKSCVKVAVRAMEHQYSNGGAMVAVGRRGTTCATLACRTCSLSL
eukprot:scaffold198276_cov39-Tisochrysis_lutea.AAC.1